MDRLPNISARNFSLVPMSGINPSLPIAVMQLMYRVATFAIAFFSALARCLASHSPRSTEVFTEKRLENSVDKTYELPVIQPRTPARSITISSSSETSVSGSQERALEALSVVVERNKAQLIRERGQVTEIQRSYKLEDDENKYDKILIINAVLRDVARDGNPRLNGVQLPKEEGIGDLWRERIRERWAPFFSAEEMGRVLQTVEAVIAGGNEERIVCENCLALSDILEELAKKYPGDNEKVFGCVALLQQSIFAPDTQSGLDYVTTKLAVRGAYCEQHLPLDVRTFAAKTEESSSFNISTEAEDVIIHATCKTKYPEPLSAELCLDCVIAVDRDETVSKLYRVDHPASRG